MVAPAAEDATVIERVTPRRRRRSPSSPAGKKREPIHVAETPAQRLAHDAEAPTRRCRRRPVRLVRRIEARSSTCRSTVTPICRARRAQQLRTVAASGKRGEIRDRRGMCSPTAWTRIRSTRFRPKSRIRRRPPRSVRRARRLLARRSPGAGRRIRRGRAFVYVRRQVTPDQARRVADLQLEGVGFMKENRRFYPNKELAAHLLGYVGLDNTGSPASKRRTTI
jgi:hypothetical protein